MEDRKKRKKINMPPRRAASLKPGQRLMEKYIEREPFAVAIIEAWNPARSLVRRQTVRFVRPERQSRAARPLDGVCVANAGLDGLLATWRATRSPEALGTVILSTRPYLERICRSITRSDDYSELLGEVEAVLLELMEDDSAAIYQGNVKAYLYGVAQKLHASMLRRQYLRRKTKDGEQSMTRFLPLSAADHLTTDDDSSRLDDLWERPASTIDDPAVEAIAEMLQGGKTIEQVCEALAISRSAVYKRIGRYLARRHSGVVDLNACADELHSVQDDSADELHNVQSTWGTRDFSEILSDFPVFADYIMRGDFVPLRNAAL